MKTKEELTAPKEEVEAVNRKLHELTEEELAQVTGGGVPVIAKPGEVQGNPQPKDEYTIITYGELGGSEPPTL